MSVQRLLLVSAISSAIVLAVEAPLVVHTSVESARNTPMLGECLAIIAHGEQMYGARKRRALLRAGSNVFMRQLKTNSIRRPQIGFRKSRCKRLKDYMPEK